MKKNEKLQNSMQAVYCMPQTCIPSFFTSVSPEAVLVMLRVSRFPTGVWIQKLDKGSDYCALEVGANSTLFACRGAQSLSQSKYLKFRVSSTRHGTSRGKRWSREPIESFFPFKMLENKNFLAKKDTLFSESSIHCPSAQNTNKFCEKMKCLV